MRNFLHYDSSSFHSVWLLAGHSVYSAVCASRSEGSERYTSYVFVLYHCIPYIDTYSYGRRLASRFTLPTFCQRVIRPLISLESSSVCGSPSESGFIAAFHSFPPCKEAKPDNTLGILMFLESQHLFESLVTYHTVRKIKARVRHKMQLNESFLSGNTLGYQRHGQNLAGDHVEMRKARKTKLRRRRDTGRDTR